MPAWQTARSPTVRSTPTPPTTPGGRRSQSPYHRPTSVPTRRTPGAGCVCSISLALVRHPTTRRPGRLASRATRSGSCSDTAGSARGFLADRCEHEDPAGSASRHGGAAISVARGVGGRHAAKPVASVRLSIMFCGKRWRWYAVGWLLPRDAHGMRVDAVITPRAARCQIPGPGSVA